jgi:tudor domain-containing protein 2
MKSTSVLPLAAGILGVGALIYIYYRQRDKDKKKKTTNTDNNGMPSSSSPSLSNDTIETLEFKVSNLQVPLIVGRNSVTLKQIEDKTSTTIRFRESDEDNQICTIKGKANNVKIAKELVDIEGAKPSVITEELLVSTSSCGKIEGYGGTVLHEICQKSSAKIWIDPGTRKVQGENRRVLITGTKEQVDLAKKLIDEKSKEPITPPQLEPIEEQKKSPRPSPYASNSSITTTETPREILLPSPEKLKTNDSQLEVSAVASPSR